MRCEASLTQLRGRIQCILSSPVDPAKWLNRIFSYPRTWSVRDAFLQLLMHAAIADPISDRKTKAFYQLRIRLQTQIGYFKLKVHLRFICKIRRKIGKIMY